MDEDDFEPADPSDLGFDPYAGGYIDDDPVDLFEYDYEDEFYGNDFE